MTYYQREKQLTNTLESLKRYNPDDFSVFIVDDNSPYDIKLPALPFEVTIIKLREKKWINPGVTFNIGFEYALKTNPEIILIQNAECYHNGDILGYVLGNLTDENYLSFACYSLGKGQDVNLRKLNNKCATYNGHSAWYNHSKYRPEALHFCVAITAKNLKKLNGFDGRFANLLGYEDNYFIHQVKTLGLGIQIIDNPFVFHQYHYDVKSFKWDPVLYAEAGQLCEALKKENTYRAKHIYTNDL